MLWGFLLFGWWRMILLSLSSLILLFMSHFVVVQSIWKLFRIEEFFYRREISTIIFVILNQWAKCNKVPSLDLQYYREVGEKCTGSVREADASRGEQRLNLSSIVHNWCRPKPLRRHTTGTFPQGLLGTAMFNKDNKEDIGNHLPARTLYPGMGQYGRHLGQIQLIPMGNNNNNGGIRVLCERVGEREWRRPTGGGGWQIDFRFWHFFTLGTAHRVQDKGPTRQFETHFSLCRRTRRKHFENSSKNFDEIVYFWRFHQSPILFALLVCPDESPPTHFYFTFSIMLRFNGQD